MASRKRTVALVLVGLGVAAIAIAVVMTRRSSGPAPATVVAPGERPRGVAVPGPARRRAAAAAAGEGPAVEPEPAGLLRLEGQVVDEAERPVAGATVTLSSTPRRQVTSEGDGSFVFEHLVPRTYTVSATKE